jgi:hypothetical protein
MERFTCPVAQAPKVGQLIPSAHASTGWSVVMEVKVAGGSVRVAARGATGDEAAKVKPPATEPVMVATTEPTKPPVAAPAMTPEPVAADPLKVLRALVEQKVHSAADIAQMIAYADTEVAARLPKKLQAKLVRLLKAT